MMKNKNLEGLKNSFKATGFFLLAITACTKEVPYKSLPVDEKVQIYDKALIDTESEYLYSSSQQMSSMSSQDAFPFYSSDNKRVKIRLTENFMQILEVERDLRFASNNNNDKLTLEIPVKHTEFQCAKDNFGDCTNKEEVAADIPWQLRKNLKIEAQKITSGQLELLPLMDFWSQAEGCYSEKSSELIYSKVEPDAINFQIKKTYLTNINCLNTLDKISDATVSAVYHYSLVKVKSVLSSDYKVISYPISSKDENTFGFFTTSRLNRDVDLNPTDQSRIQIMNRWNPNRKEINYFLSDEFAKPENKSIRDLTFKTVENLNAGLDSAGVNFRIKLQQGQNKIPGDIRNSMIVLVEDPVASSVIGYGPQTEDPITGEIISARTVMFLGTIKTFIKQTYNDIIDAKKAQVLSKNEDKVLDSKLLSLSDDLKMKSLSKVNTGKTFGINSKISEINNLKKSSEVKKDSVVLAKTDIPSSKFNLVSIKNDLKSYTRNKNQEYSGQDLKSKFKYLQEVKNCAFRAQADGLSAQISQKLIDQFPTDAKPWAQLSDKEKQNVIDIILPEVWIPTLIHELGHNLGLRHNFQGSEDKENFYSNEELVALNIDHKIPFSSVMEYGDDLKALPVLGKYDIAALRFGYNRQIEVLAKDGSASFVQIPETIEKLELSKDQKIKDYGYCTDENVGINAGCRRFDLGTTYTEITQNMINEYEKLYTTRNFRNGREDMSYFGDFSYAARIGRVFEDLRTMLQVKERIKYRFGIPEGHPIWQEIDFLKDLNTASVLAGQQLARVIATPDLTCAISMKSNPSQIVAVFNIKQVDPDALSCFNADLSNGDLSQFAPVTQVVAETGKLFNSKKDPNSRNNFADQIDVRGYWIDKVQALNALLKRQTPLYKYSRPVFTFDKYNDSFLNQSEVGQPVVDMLLTIMQNNIVDQIPFRLPNGAVAELEISYDLAESQIIEKHMSPRIADILGINADKPTHLQEQISKVLAAEAKDNTGANPEDAKLKSVVSVFKFNSLTTIPNIKDSLRVNLGENSVYVSTAENVLAKDMMMNLTISQRIEAVSSEKLQEIIDAKKQNNQPAKDISPEEKAVWKLDLQVLLDYQNEIIKASTYYENMIQVLPQAN